MKTTAQAKRPISKPYTIKSAAAYLNFSPTTIRKLIKQRVLRVSSIVPGKLLIPAADVENLVESTCGP
jgi:excisionase family DNA binding protein